MYYNNVVQIYLEILRINALIANIPKDKREKILSELSKNEKEQLSILLKKLRDAIQEIIE